jgi:hypothetical protein
MSHEIYIKQICMLFSFLFILFVTASDHVDQAGLKLTILPPQPALPSAGTAGMPH